ncbi:MAG: serine hydrolase domain-containing protein, partial [Promethearchaeota archaeon]
MDKVIKRLCNDIKTAMEKGNIPGLAVSLIDKDGILWIEGFGFTDQSKSRKVDPDTIFCIGSTTKPITAVAFLRAVQKGFVNLDDFLISYYPEFTINSTYGANEVNKITFRHLLSHYAGLPHNPLLREYYVNKPSFEDSISSISETWLVSQVGKNFYYSNSGFDLIAYSLQRICNINYPEYVRDEIIKPLEMNSMVYGKKMAQKNPNCTIGYLGPHEALFTDIVNYGCTGAYVSVKDLSNFVLFQLNNGLFNGKQVLKKELLEEMRRIIYRGTHFLWPINYGLGMVTNIERIKGFNLCGHGGGGHGYSCNMWFIVDHGIGIIVLANQIGIIVLANQGFHDNREIAEKALRLLLKKRNVSIPEEKNESINKIKNSKFKTDRVNERRSPGPDNKEWRKHIGLYRGRVHGNPLYFGINIKNGYLVMKRLVTGKLKEYTPNIFFNPLNEAVIFKKNTMIFMGSLFKKVDNIASKLKKLA